MPIYEYRCERGHTFEALQRMSEEPLDACQVCDAPATRVLYPPAVHFKGSGFYNTDYGTRKRAREKGGAEGAGGGEATGGEGKGAEAKPAPSEGSGAKKPDTSPAASNAS